MYKRQGELSLITRTITKVGTGPDGTTCFLKAGGTVTCTQASWLKTSDLPWLAHDIAVTKDAACVIKRNIANPTPFRSVSCTGTSKLLSNDFPSGKRYTQIEAGLNFVCTAQEDGTLRCICDQGKDSSCLAYQAFSDNVSSFFGTNISQTNVKHIGAKGRLLCGIVGSEGKIVCGRSQEEQVSFFNFQQTNALFETGILTTPPGQNYVRISVSSTHACALHKEGNVTCWGSSSDEELVNMMLQVNRETQGKKYGHVVTGWKTTCAQEEESKKVQCWGTDVRNQAPINVIPLMLQ